MSPLLRHAGRRHCIWVAHSSHWPAAQHMHWACSLACPAGRCPPWLAQPIHYPPACPRRTLLHPHLPSLPALPCLPRLQFVELHGDRGGLDDPAMVCGLGSIDGVSFMFIGHQKGRNTKVRRRWVRQHSKAGCSSGLEKQGDPPSSWAGVAAASCCSVPRPIHPTANKNHPSVCLPPCRPVVNPPSPPPPPPFAGEHLPQLWHAPAQRLPQGAALHAPRRQVWVPHRHLCGHPGGVRRQGRGGAGPGGWGAASGLGGARLLAGWLCR